MSKRVLFLINGLGLGNSTRCHAVIEHLMCMGNEVGIVTSGNGTWYFRNNQITDNIFEIDQFNYAKRQGRLDVLGTILSSTTMYHLAKRNSVVLEEALRTFNPHVVVADSVYSVRAIKRTGLPLVHINNADVVVSNFKKYSMPRSVRFQYYAIERLDYIFHKRASDLVLSPSLEPSSKQLHKKILRMPPIVRPGLKPAKTIRKDRAIIMLSGSSFGTQPRLSQSGFGMPVEIVGRDNSEATNYDRADITFIGRTGNSIKYINKANFAVVNGGFSAVSEMFVRGCPMVVVPVPGHSEQYVNATTVERLGVGLIAKENEIEDKLKELISRADEFLHRYCFLTNTGNGAVLAAEAIAKIG